LTALAEIRLRRCEQWSL